MSSIEITLYCTVHLNISSLAHLLKSTVNRDFTHTIQKQQIKSRGQDLGRREANFCSVAFIRESCLFK